MVNYCFNCGASLPYATMVIRDGKEFLDPDQICFHCKRPVSELAYLPPVTNAETNALTDKTVIDIIAGRVSVTEKK